MTSPAQTQSSSHSMNDCALSRRPSTRPFVPKGTPDDRFHSARRSERVRRGAGPLRAAESAPSSGERDDAALREAMNRVRIEVGRAVVGQDGTVTGLLIALLARGHVLLEGVPGVAKTLLVRAFSTALGLDTKRIQFTPDLMPGDVSGSLVYDARAGEFEFRPGPGLHERRPGG